MKPKYIIALVVVFVLISIAFYSVENILPYSPIKPHIVKSNELRNDLVIKLHEVKTKYSIQIFKTVGFNSIELQCLFIKPNFEMKPNGTILILHGIADRKESMLYQAILLVENNFAVILFDLILFDLRAHGESNGEYCTFGYYEKYDVSNVITSALKQFGNLEPIGIFGNSLGAAVSLQAMEIDKRIKCGVIESSFADLRETVYDYMQRIMFVRIEWLADHALLKSERLAQFKVDSVKPEVSSRNITAPVLIVHGESDHNISIEYGKRIFKNLRSERKEFYPVPEAGHYDVSKIGGSRLEGKIISFFNTNLH